MGQTLHADHLVTTQSIGQACALQMRVLCSLGHRLPPYSVATLTLRFLVSVPEPHDFVHALKAVHLDTWQSTGQNIAPHSLDSDRGGQALPPAAIALEIFLIRICAPPPHVTEHEPKTPHAATAQSTGHLWVLQLRPSLKAGQRYPPKLAWVVTLLERFCCP